MLRASHLQRFAAVGLVTLLVSLGALVNPALIDFFSPMEIALAWLGHFVELAAIALALLAAYTLLDAALPRRMRWRLSVMVAVLFGVSLLLTLLLYGYYAHSFQHLPPRTRLLADSLHWGLPAIFLALIADVQGRAFRRPTPPRWLPRCRRRSSTRARASNISRFCKPRSSRTFSSTC